MRKYFALTAIVALAACSPQTTASVGTSVNTTVSNAATAGQLFCAKASALGPITVAIADLAGAPVTVTNQAAAWVASVCAVISAIPVTPPTVAVPTVAVDTTSIPSTM